MTATAAVPTQARPRTPLITGDRLVPAAVGLGMLGFAARLLVVHIGGGLQGDGNYDDAVYFSAADALVHGRLPYRDFLFLQPPGILVVLAPFAALGSLVGDPAGWAAARVGFLLLGGLNTALVVLTLRRFGGFAPLLGGLLYAFFIPAIYSERSTILEPVGTVAILLTSAVIADERRVDRWIRDPALLACGAVFGLAVTTKLWYALPAALMLPLLRRGAVAFATGAAAVGLLVVGPFLLVAPAATWREVVVDQLGRPRIHSDLLGRMSSIVQVPLLPFVPHRWEVVLALVLLAVLAAVALTVQGARRYVVQLAAAVALLAAAPSYYRHYAALAVPFLVLIVAVAIPRIAQRAGGGRRGRVVNVLLLALVVVYAIGGWKGAGLRTFIRQPLPASFVAAVHRQPGCLTADDPTWLILTDRLTADLDAGCAVWPDTSGWRYDRDADFTAKGPVPLPEDTPWQGHVLGFLATGRAALLHDPQYELSRTSRAQLRILADFGRGGFEIAQVRSVG